MNINCIKCAGTGKMLNGEPCPDCSKDNEVLVPIVHGVPTQYQGIKFDKSFLPEKVQKTYGTFMEELLVTILHDYAFYQKNMLICSRPNSGKTVWAYNLYSELVSKGYNIPPLRDITEVRDILNSYSDKNEANLLSTARCAIVKIPRDIQPWMFDTMSYLVERRVRSNGFTIFLFGGTLEDLNMLDRFDKLRYLRGTGAYNTIKVESFNI